MRRDEHIIEFAGRNIGGVENDDLKMKMKNLFYRDMPVICFNICYQSFPQAYQDVAVKMSKLRTNNIFTEIPI